MKSIKPAIFFAFVSLLWAGVSIYAMTLQISVGLIMLAFTLVPLAFMGYEIYEYRVSRNAYKKFLEEERAKLGLTDTPIESDEPEFIEDEEDDEEYQEYIEYAEEIEELREFDNDSGKGYCPYCGNYSVNSEKICESCGENVNE